MKLKSMVYKAIGALSALMAAPGLGHAFTANPAHRESYNGLTPHEHWDEIWHETMVDITVIGVLFGLFSLYLMFGFLRSKDRPNGEPVQLSPQAAIGWAVIPIVLFLADDLFLFAKGFDLHNHYREVPADAREVKLTGSMWSWTYNYGNDVETYGELIVPVGKPVLLRMTSEDVVHSHYLNKFRVTEDLMPGRVTWQWFMPNEEGETVISCREYCGENHSRMYGKVKVLSQADFDAWYAEQSGTVAPAADAAATDGAAPADAAAASPAI